MPYYEITPGYLLLMPNRYYNEAEYFYHAFMFRIKKLDDYCTLKDCEYCFYNKRIIKKIIKFQRKWRKFYYRYCNIKSIIQRQITGKF